MSDQEQQQQQKQDAGKEARKFDANWRKVIALMKGDTIFKPSRLGGEDLEKALTELVKEEKDRLIVEFKGKVHTLVKSKSDFDKFVKEQQKKMEQAILDKKKELNKEMTAIFGIVDKIEQIERQYYNSMTEMIAPPAEPTTNEAESDEPAGQDDSEGAS